MALSPLNHKSSVLCPKSRHITTQYLALEQIEAHHKMVSHAKHNLDMAAPKSMKSYISNIDRKKKSFWPRESPLHPPSSSSFIKNSDEILRGSTNLLDNEKIEEDKETIHTSMSLNKSIQAGVPYPTLHSKVADKISWYLEAISQGEFQSQTLNLNLPKGGARHYGSQISLSSSLRSYRVIKGDLIEWHKNHFTSTKKDFSPRILANNGVKSKIRDMRCYNPPQKKESHYSEESSDTFDSYDADNDEVEEEMDEKESETKEASNNENETSVRDVDADHQNWLSEQALRAEIRHKFGTKFKHQSSMASILKNDNYVTSKNYTSGTLHALNRDEEDNYLKFLTDVTEDILRSGVYSDRAIQQTFEFHLQFCPENSDKEKIKHLLDQMLESFRAHNDDNEDLLSKRNVLIRNDSSLEKDVNDQKNTNEVMEFNLQDMSNLVHSDVEKNENAEKNSMHMVDKES